MRREEEKRKKKISSSQRTNVARFSFFLESRVRRASVSMKDLRIRVVPWSGVPAFRHTLSRSVALASNDAMKREEGSRASFFLPLETDLPVDPIEITLHRELPSSEKAKCVERKEKRRRNSYARGLVGEMMEKKRVVSSFEPRFGDRGWQSGSKNPHGSRKNDGAREILYIIGGKREI